MNEQRPGEWLFEVEEVLDLSSLGLQIVCRLEPSCAVLRVGDSLTFRCADGQEIETQVKQIPMIHRSLHRPNLVSIELPRTPQTLRISAGAETFRRAHRS